jgi:hypothetical protein
MGLEDVLAAASALAESPASTPAAPSSNGSATEQMQQPEPFAPHDGWLHGPPKPACHEARIVAADGINSLRQTRDGEIGACPTAAATRRTGHVLTAMMLLYCRMH